MARVAIIGAGFSGLSAAAYCAAFGHNVHVFEKNATVGGRARQMNTDNGYVFDMGPSWYWMPDVFEAFFADFGYQSSDFYDLKLLDPSFDMVFKPGQPLHIPADYNGLLQLFESIEKGSSGKLETFLKEAQYKYEAGMKRLVYMPGLSLLEFADAELIRGAIRLQVFTSLSRHVRKYFKNPALVALMEFPVLFLGAMPRDTPALYSLMNYAALKLGTWYPMGGFGKVATSLRHICEELKVDFHFNSPVEKITSSGNRVSGIRVKGKELSFDAVISAADYHHTEHKLLAPEYRNYKESYWKKKTFAPSSLIFYIGIKKKIDKLQHHTLFFEEDFEQHSREIYKNPRWPARPLFYVCCTSRTDDAVAPAGHENLFILMPVAAGLKDDASTREKYFHLLMERLEKHLGESIRNDIDYKSSYCINDFISDYHSYKGNAYGLANTLSQTAILKPTIRNRKLKNLFYAGQLTVPGPGVPPALISGKIAAQQLQKQLKKQMHEGEVRSTVV